MPDAPVTVPAEAPHAPSSNGHLPVPPTKDRPAHRRQLADLRVIYYNVTRLLFVELLSRGFVWVAIATWVGLTVINSSKVLPETVYWGYGAHVVIAFLYWAARDQFVEIIDAVADWLRGVKVTRQG
jgi:hypothetical protein